MRKNEIVNQFITQKFEKIFIHISQKAPPCEFAQRRFVYFRYNLLFQFTRFASKALVKW